MFKNSWSKKLISAPQWTTYKSWEEQCWSSKVKSRNPKSAKWNAGDSLHCWWKGSAHWEHTLPSSSKQTVIVVTLATILDRNVKKNEPCMSHFLILPSKAQFTQDISPSSPPKKQFLSVARTFLLPTKQHWPGRGGGGVTMVPNLQGASTMHKKVQNS